MEASVDTRFFCNWINETFSFENEVGNMQCNVTIQEMLMHTSFFVRKNVHKLGDLSKFQWLNVYTNNKHCLF